MYIYISAVISLDWSVTDTPVHKKTNTSLKLTFAVHAK